MYIARFPAEVLYNIFSKLDRRDAYNCLFVCSSWYKAAILVIYRDITINAERTEELNYAIYEHSLSPFEKYGKLVRSVKFYNDYTPEPFSISEFGTVISWWPNLQLIDMYHSENTELYLEYLKEDSDIVLDYLQQIKVDVFFKKTNSLVIDISELAFQTNLKYCKTLTYIKAYEPAPYLEEDNKTNPFSFLHLFKSLTGLYYYSVNANAVTPAKIQEILPNLTSLDFQMFFYNRGNRDTISPLIQKSKTLKTLTLNFDNFTHSLIENLTSNITSNLEELNLYASKEYDLSRLIEREEISDVFNFASMLNKVPVLSLNANGSFLLDSRETELSYALANMRKPLVYTFLNNVISNRKFVSCHVSYSNLDLCSKIHISGEPGNQKLEYGSYYNEETAPPLELDITLERADIVTSLSYSSYRTDTPFPEIGLEFFISKYPNLEHLEIEGGIENEKLSLTENLTVLGLTELTLTKVITTTLNKYAPNINKIYYKAGDVSNNTKNNVYLDLREYDRLQDVVFTFENAFDKHYNRLIIHFSFEDRPDEYYLLLPKRNDLRKFDCTKVRSEFVSEFKKVMEIGEVHFKFKTVMNKVIICNEYILALFSNGMHITQLPQAACTTLESLSNEIQKNV